jgi:DNA repair exonuclease SbcCD ATPase subunit
VIRLQHLRVTNFKSLRDIDLAFPRAGSVLIEGLNESGKSTLFEAVYFALYGRPLVMEAGIESTIRYGAQQSFVELGLSVDATDIVIQRYTRVGRRTALLTIAHSGEEPETVTALNAISARIIDELRLDGDTLLNSCFVEQKKLQRLEGLTAAARRDSLMKLLNLEGLTRLETQFRLGRQDDEAIQLATQRRDLGQVRADIPARLRDLVCTERRVAARRIVGALDRIETHAVEIRQQEDRRALLAAEQLHLEARLARIAALTDIDQSLGRLEDTGKRRLTLAAAETSARVAIDEVVRLRDAALPAVVERLTAVQDLTARTEWLERCEAGTESLRDGAKAWADADALDERARTLESTCAAVGEQIQLVSGLREALQRVALQDERTQQLDVTHTAVDQLDRQIAQLHTRAELLPAERDSEQQLLAAAASLESAEFQLVNASRRRDSMIVLHDTAVELDRALSEQRDALTGLQSPTTDLEQARAELREAEAARTQNAAPVLRAWIRARNTADRGEEARRQEPAAVQREELAEQHRQRAAAAAASVSSRAALELGGAVVALAGGALVLVGLGSPAGMALLIVGLIVGALGIRTLAGRGSIRSAAQTAGHECAQSRQHLAELRTSVASALDSQVQLEEAESLLREMGSATPSDLADADARLTAALAQEGEQQQALDRVETARTAVDELARRHVDAQLRARTSQASLETVERQLALAQHAAEASPDADAEQLLGHAEQELGVALDNRTSSCQVADSLLESATPERLRIEAASKHAAIEEAETQLRSLPDLEQRLQAEQVRAATLTQTIATERHVLDDKLHSLPIDGNAELRPALQTHLEGLDEAALQTTQARLNAEIGGARETAQRQRLAATKAWQSAVASVAPSAQSDNALAMLASDVRAVASSAVASPHTLFVEIERLELEEQTHREALTKQAANVGEPLDLPRLREASTELAAERRQIVERVEQLPVLGEHHSRAAANLATVDSELQLAWADVESRLDAVGVADRSRAIDPLRQRLGTEIRSLDEPVTRSRLDRVIAELADATGTIRHRLDQIADEERSIAVLLAGVGVRSDQLDRPSVAVVLPEVEASDLPDEEPLVAERERLMGEIGHLKTVEHELETTLDLRDIVLDLAEEKARLDHLVHAREIKKRATRIIATARTRMMDRVLPGTEQNLRLLLPQLTAERYYDAKLDGEYRLSVWDTAAQRYVAKDIFSGGTRDQFSLALRLAFALATLPQELGTTPGFIFLDEPLSAFDLPRTEALVALLTQGQIAKSFDQIFLISHSRSFDPALFGYYVRMEAGRVAETNLSDPNPHAAA